MSIVIPVILSGGAGTRLWPLSRESRPKQFLALDGDHTLLQQAALRASAISPTPPIVVANLEHRFVVAEQLRLVGVTNCQIALEPVGRNTAPAIATAALLALQLADDPLLVITPSDHIIRDGAALQRSIATAAPAAAAGAMALFGVTPTRAETGYGYIRPGPTKGDVREVAAFIEKPDRATAMRFYESGEYLWNAGIFLLSARAVIEALQQFEPLVVESARAALTSGTADHDFIRLDHEAFAKSPAISIDRAVMERTDRAAVVHLNCLWSDAGTWSALWELGTKDGDGNVTVGDTIALDARNTYVRTEGPLVAALGVDDLIVVATSDAVLVTRRGADQQVSALVGRLRQSGSPTAAAGPQVHRPWGYYQSVHSGERFQVKRITVNPGARLSLQKHRHRAEHWIVVNGTALVTRDREQVLLGENESIFLPLGCIHRLENPGDTTLNLIEVQSGGYLGEDDIIRIEDDFGRAPVNGADTPPS